MHNAYCTVIKYLFIIMFFFLNSPEEIIIGGGKKQKINRPHTCIQLDHGHRETALKTLNWNFPIERKNYTLNVSIAKWNWPSNAGHIRHRCRAMWNSRNRRVTNLVKIIEWKLNSTKVLYSKYMRCRRTFNTWRMA